MRRLFFAFAILFASKERRTHTHAAFREFPELKRLRAERDKLLQQVEEAEERSKALLWGEK